MPMQSFSKSFSGRMPSLVSVYGDDTHVRKSLSSPGRDMISPRLNFNDRIRVNPSPSPISTGTSGHFSPFTFRHDSVSTTTSDSANSSPTTTASLVESCSTFSETPGTSPDTPASTQSLSYPPLFIPMHGGLDRQPTIRLAALTELSRPNPPTRKPRNLKNLAVDTSSASSLGRAVSTASLPLQGPHDSPLLLTPSSPTFLKPLIPPRRKTSKLGLTILTPGADSQLQQSFAGPPTPSLIRPATLRQLQSSPSLPILSPSIGPEGGMKILSFPRPLVPVGFAPALSEQDEDEHLRNFDAPQSREEKLAGYPDGPICIYDPHIYLYFEPTAQEASQYDVIFNVASEVENPFSPAMQIKELANIQISPPATPKVTDSLHGAAENGSTHQPEYIHVPWEHNTDIVPDLDHLVRVVDARVQRGKRILIHCQCGVSRSASLIVAYGLYKNPSISVQEAYDAVKRRSKWIGPNMNLIMQLQEFRSGLLKSNNGLSSKQPPQPSIRISSSGRPSTKDQQDVRLPRSAPLPPEAHKIVTAPASTNSTKTLSTGPSSAPSDFHWPSTHRSATIAKQTTTEPSKVFVSPPVGYIDSTREMSPGNSEAPRKQSLKAGGLKLAVRTTLECESPRAISAPWGRLDQEVASPRSAEFAMVSVLPPDLDNSFHLTSPRITGFVNPFGTGTSLFHTVSGVASQNAPIHIVKDSESYKRPPLLSQVDDSAGITLPKTTTVNTDGYYPTTSDCYTDHTGHEFSQTINSAQADAQARAESKSPLGMSKSLDCDSISEYQVFVSQPTVLPTSHLPLSPVPFLASSHFTSESAFPEALLSPRATEFTENPFHDALLNILPSDAGGNATGNGGDAPPKPKPSTDDPRSPAQKGASPIIRNIFDVF